MRNLLNENYYFGFCHIVYPAIVHNLVKTTCHFHEIEVIDESHCRYFCFVGAISATKTATIERFHYQLSLDTL